MNELVNALVIVFLFIIGIITPNNFNDEITNQTIVKENIEEKSFPIQNDDNEAILNPTGEVIFEKNQTQEVKYNYTQSWQYQTSGNNKTQEVEYYIVTRIIDGDTIEINTSERVRLICIDTPERGQDYYFDASNYLQNLILYKEVGLVRDISEKDRYGRLLRYVYTKDGTFVNELIVYNGYGKAYPYIPDTKLCPIIRQAEQHAKNNKLGIWVGEEQRVVVENEITSEPELSTPKTKTTEKYVCDYNYYNCGDFNTHSEAQNVFEMCGGISNDIHDLDRDNDGIACESL